MAERQVRIEAIEAIDSAIEEIKAEWRKHEIARAQLVAEHGEDPRPRPQIARELAEHALGPTSWLFNQGSALAAVDSGARIPAKQVRPPAPELLPPAPAVRLETPGGYRLTQVERTSIVPPYQTWARQYQGRFEVHLVWNPRDFPKVERSICGVWSTDSSPDSQKWFRAWISPSGPERAQVCDACVTEVEQGSRTPLIK